MFNRLRARLRNIIAPVALQPTQNVPAAPPIPPNFYKPSRTDDRKLRDLYTKLAIVYNSFARRLQEPTTIITLSNRANAYAAIQDIRKRITKISNRVFVVDPNTPVYKKNLYDWLKFYRFLEKHQQDTSENLVDFVDLFQNYLSDLKSYNLSIVGYYQDVVRGPDNFYEIKMDLLRIYEPLNPRSEMYVYKMSNQEIMQYYNPPIPTGNVKNDYFKKFVEFNVISKLFAAYKIFMDRTNLNFNDILEIKISSLKMMFFINNHELLFEYLNTRIIENIRNKFILYPSGVYDVEINGGSFNVLICEPVELLTKFMDVFKKILNKYVPENLGAVGNSLQIVNGLRSDIAVPESFEVKLLNFTVGYFNNDYSKEKNAFNKYVFINPYSMYVSYSLGGSISKSSEYKYTLTDSPTWILSLKNEVQYSMYKITSDINLTRNNRITLSYISKYFVKILNNIRENTENAEIIGIINFYIEKYGINPYFERSKFESNSSADIMQRILNPNAQNKLIWDKNIYRSEVFFYGGKKNTVLEYTFARCLDSTYYKNNVGLCIPDVFIKTANCIDLNTGKPDRKKQGKLHVNDKLYDMDQLLTDLDNRCYDRPYLEHYIRGGARLDKMIYCEPNIRRKEYETTGKCGATLDDLLYLCNKYKYPLYIVGLSGEFLISSPGDGTKRAIIGYATDHHFYPLTDTPLDKELRKIITNTARSGIKLKKLPSDKKIPTTMLVDSLDYESFHKIIETVTDDLLIVSKNPVTELYADLIYKDRIVCGYGSSNKVVSEKKTEITQFTYVVKGKMRADENKKMRAVKVYVSTNPDYFNFPEVYEKYGYKKSKTLVSISSDMLHNYLAGLNVPIYSTFNELSKEFHIPRAQKCKIYKKMHSIPHEHRENLYGIDYRGMYWQQCLMKNPYDYLSFSPCETPFKTNEFLGTGYYYYVETADRHLFNKSGVYPGFLVEYAKTEGIEFTITHAHRATYKIPATIFRNLFEELIKTLSYADAKRFACYMHGLTGCGSAGDKKYHSYFIESDQEFFYLQSYLTSIGKELCHNGLKFKYPDDDGNIHTLNSLTYKDFNELYENLIPIYNHTIALSYLRMYELRKYLLAQGTEDNPVKIYYIKTDCFGYYAKERINPPGVCDCAEGCVKTEEHIYKHEKFSPPAQEMIQKKKPDVHLDKPILNIFTPEFVDGVEIDSPDMYIKNAVDTIMQRINKNQGILMLGGPGYGKSTVIEKLQQRLKEKNINFRTAAPTHVAKEKLTTSDDVARTLHNLFGIDISAKVSKTKLKTQFRDVKVIIIDEISMLDTVIEKCMYYLKTVLPKLVFVLSGDFQQIPPIESYQKYYIGKCKLARDNRSPPDHVFKVLGSYGVMYMTKNLRSNNNTMDLCQRLYENPALLTKIPPEGNELFKKSVDVRVALYNISYKNETRINVNRIINCYMIETMKPEKIYDIDHKEEPYKVFPGCYLISNSENDKDTGIYNGSQFKVKKIENDVVTLDSLFTPGNEKTVPLSMLKKKFVLAHCITSHKSQSLTIPFDFNIYDTKAGFYNRNCIYTIFSRTVDKSKIRIVTPEGQYESR